jgi:DNA modification methylase
MNELINSGVHVNKIITSPPYNIMRPNGDNRGYDMYKDGMSNEEYIQWTLDIFNCYDKLMSPNGCILYNMSYGSDNTEIMNLTVADILRNTEFTLADVLVWKKNSAFPNGLSPNKMTRICEFVYVFCRRSEFYTFTTNKKITSRRENTDQAMYENMFNFFEAQNNDGRTELNLCTFSVDFVQNLLYRYVRSDDIVLDNFSGTGTTLCACVSKSIKSIGIELSTPQCAYTVGRLNSGVIRKFF